MGSFKLHTGGADLKSRRSDDRFDGSTITLHLADLAAFSIRRVRDIGRGGFSIETDGAVPLGRLMHFELEIEKGVSAAASAAAVYCREAGVQQPSRFVSGWAFIRSHDLDGALDRLLARLTPAATT
jgi:hypothetical protein